MEGYIELLAKLKKIKEKGYIKTHRAGNTGIGKTLEDLLGIAENNIPGPNGHMVELKSGRKNSQSMLTLFTKSPKPSKANTALLQKYGYPSRKGNNKKELHTTVNAIDFNILKSGVGFKIVIKDDKIELISRNKETTGYWSKATLQRRFETKLPCILYVKAESRNAGADEEFWYNEVFLLSGFDFENFLKLLQEGKILVDIRIGQYVDGSAHDHGTAFRVFPDNLELCFSKRTKLI